MLLLVLVVASFLSESLAQREGDGCRLRSSAPGVCRRLRHCEAARGAWPQLCSGRGRGNLVCCPEPAGATAARMCREYTAAAWKKERSPVLLLGDSEEVEYLEPVCGLEGSTPLIIGGTPTQVGEFPHMAAVGFGNNSEFIMWVCGGALISEWFVLTAGHCLQDPNGPDGARWVLLGDISLEGNDTSGDRQLLGVAERIAYPQYRRPIRYHDIALLRLERAARLGANVRPACLHLGSPLRSGTAIATGWGKVSDEQPISEDLLKVKLTIQPVVHCLATFNVTATPRLLVTLPQGIREESMMCAGEMAGGKDTCQGDSGGPLQVPMDEQHCMYSIVGVTSFGKSCAQPNQPAVYTRVSHYVRWIESIVWKSITRA